MSIQLLPFCPNFYRKSRRDSPVIASYLERSGRSLVSTKFPFNSYDLSCGIERECTLYVENGEGARIVSPQRGLVTHVWENGYVVTEDDVRNHDVAYMIEIFSPISERTIFLSHVERAPHIQIGSVVGQGDYIGNLRSPRSEGLDIIPHIHMSTLCGGRDSFSLITPPRYQ